MTPSSLPAHISVVMMNRKQAHVLPQVLNHLATSCLGFPPQPPPYIVRFPISAPQSGKKVPFIGRRSEFLWNSFPPFFSLEASLQTSNSIPPSLFLSQDGIAVQDTQLGGEEERGRHLWRRRREKEKGKRCCWHRPCPTRRKTLSPSSSRLLLF